MILSILILEIPTRQYLLELQDSELHLPIIVHDVVIRLKSVRPNVTILQITSKIHKL